MRKVVTIMFMLSIVHANAQQNFAKNSNGDSDFTARHVNVFMIADKMAEFPGGPKSWTKYLQRNLDYSVPLKNNASPGKYHVVVMFIIAENGAVSDLKPVTKYGFGMEDELMRLISKGPRWVPAMQKGKSVKSYRKQPVTFVVPK